MTKNAFRCTSPILGSAAIVALLTAGASAQFATIPIATGVVPESIAATPDGALLIGSFVQGIVYRVAPGATTAEPWITGIGPTITGVFAHEETVYVCSNGPFGTGEATLKTFDLATATETGSYPFPADSFCADIAVAPDGTAYITDMGAAGRLMKLTDAGLEVVIADTAITGLDGIAFLGDDLIVTNFRSNELYRINLGETPATYTTLEVSVPLDGPDGMRTTEDGTALLITDQRTNRLLSVTVDGDAATVTEIATAGLELGPAGVAQIGDTAYVVELNVAAFQQAAETLYEIKLVDLAP